MAAPTFVAVRDPGYARSNTSRTTASFAVQAGDVLIAAVGSEASANNQKPGAISDSVGLTWTQRYVTTWSVSTQAYLAVYTATVPSNQASMTVTVASPSSQTWWGFEVQQWRNVASIGTVVSANNGTGSGLPSVGITTTQANSAIAVTNADWNARDGSTRAWSSINGSAPVETSYYFNSSYGTAYTAYYADAGAAGTKTVSMTSPTAQRYVVSAVEVRGASGSTGTGSASGSWTSSASATGVIRVVSPWSTSAQATTQSGAASGSSSGSWTAAASASGSFTAQGSASGSDTWTGGSSGAATHTGLSSGTNTWTGSATGGLVTQGSASGTDTWTGSAAGARAAQGTSTGTDTWTGSSAGAFTAQGAASGTDTWTGSSTGAAPAPGANAGTASGSWTSTGSATGYTLRSISEENALAGALSSEYMITGAGDTTNVGFARNFSTNVGSTVDFSCDGTGTVLDIYRIGYYGGDGWHKVATLTNTATTQPAPQTIANSNGGVTCSNWSVTASWSVPENATPGLYVGVYRNAALNNASWIPFVIRDDSRPADIIVKTSETTWGAAYNLYGGKDLYGTTSNVFDIANRTHAVSFHRPIISRDAHDVTYWMNAEYPLIRYLERNGFNVKYVSSQDLEHDPTILDSASIFISSGHDEYWSIGMRSTVEAFRDNGGHCLFMSGNEVFWRTRFDPTNPEIMWCYKDTMDGPSTHVGGDQLDPVTWTGTWRDTRWVGRDDELNLTGTDFRMNGILNYDAVLQTADSYSSHPVWRNTSLGTSDITLTSAIGFEADRLAPTMPSGSYSVLAADEHAITGSWADDNGQNYNGNGTLTWGVVAQRMYSGSIVVGFGTCQWSWTLDDTHDNGAAYSNVNAQQMTLNLLVDLGAAPVTPMAGLTVSAAEPLDSYGVLPPNQATGSYTFSGAAVGGAAATTHSIWGSTYVPATLYSDGTPDITLADAFYKFSSAGTSVENARCVGGRVWTPVGSPAQITIMAWINPQGTSTGVPGTTPDRSTTVSTNPGGWTEASWTPFDMPADAVGVLIGYQFVGSPEYYIAHSRNATDGTTGSITAADGSNIAHAESNVLGGTYYGAYYKIGTGAVSAQTGFLYGSDIIVDEGAPVSNGIGSATGSTTWTGVASGSSGSSSGSVSTTYTFTGSAVGPSSVVTHSIWGATTPPGTYTLYTDGTPRIQLGQTFYRFSSAGTTMENGRCAGARLWCPSGITMPAQVTMRAWLNPNDSDRLGTVLTDTPLREVTVATVSGGWAEATWTPFDLPADGVPVLIGYEFTDVGDAGKYLYGNAVGDGTFVQALDGTNVVYSEANAATFKNAYFKIGSSTPQGINDGTDGYGIDIIVDEGAPVSNGIGSATGSSSWTGAASGRSATIVPWQIPFVISSGTSGASAGSASGSYTESSSASGTRQSSGVASSASTWSASVAGGTGATGSASGSFTESGSATGSFTAAATASGSWTSSGTASGASALEGSGTGSWTASGVGTGGIRTVSAWSFSVQGTTLSSTANVNAVPATAAASILPVTIETETTVSGGAPAAATASAPAPTVSGGAAAPASGTATSTNTWSGGASGAFTPDGTSSGSSTWTVASIGAAALEGSASGSTSWTGGPAAGAAAKTGSAVGTNTWTGIASASNGKTGLASGSASWSAAAQGTTTRQGSGASGYAETGSASGSVVRSGAASGSTSWTGSATSTVQSVGSASSGSTWSGASAGEIVTAGSSGGSYTTTGIASGAAATGGTSTADSSWSGTSTGIIAASGDVVSTYTFTGAAYQLPLVRVDVTIDIGTTRNSSVLFGASRNGSASIQATRPSGTEVEANSTRSSTEVGNTRSGWSIGDTRRDRNT